MEPGAVETALAALLLELNPGALRIDGSGGDQGADVVAPIQGGSHVYEIKSFAARLTPSHRKQIRDSLKTALRLRKDMRAWTLVLPLDLTPGEQVWFDDVLAPIARKIPITWIGLSRISVEFASRPFLSRQFMPAGAERRVLELASQFGNEKAVMAGGLPDALDRVQDLHRLANDTDRDFLVRDLSVGHSGTSMILEPRNPKLFGSPVTSLSLQAIANTPAARQIDEFAKYGLPLNLGAENIKQVSWNLPGAIGELFRESHPTAVSIAFDPVEPKRMLFEFIRANKSLARRSVIVTATGQGPDGGAYAEINDDSRAFTIRILQDPISSDGLPSITKNGFSLQIHIPDSLYPMDAIPVVEFLCHIQHADQFRLSTSGSDLLMGKIHAPPRSMAALLTLADHLRALHEVQEATQQFFPCPTHLTEGDVQTLYLARDLLRDGTAPCAWPKSSFPIGVPDAKRLLATAAIAPRVSMTGECRSTFIIAGQSVRLPGKPILRGKDLVVTNAAKLAHFLDAEAHGQLLIDVDQDSRSSIQFSLTKNEVSHAE
jgi:hypothetical protein